MSHQRRCNECGELKGFISFEKGSHRCKACDVGHMIKDWENGIQTMRTCYVCEEEKNAVEHFYINDNRMYYKCKECARKYGQRYKHSKGGRYFRCQLTFTFDNQRVCRKCDTVRTMDYFAKSHAVCKKCQGIAVTEEEKALVKFGRKAKMRPLNHLGEMECKHCHTFKPLEEYHKNENNVGSYGHVSKCKTCTGKIKKAKRDNNDSYIPIGRDRFIRQFNLNKERIFNGNKIQEDISMEF